MSKVMMLRVVTVGRYGSSMANFYTWRFLAHVGRAVSGRFPSERLLQEGRAYAEARQLSYDATVVHGDPCGWSDLELLGFLGRDNENEKGAET